ncbi:MAG: SLBB domain-containing protein, partial [Propionibacteriaceae bacterium]|nr:SLBB domain-containing protein [Propionibacteriaceae bacterium]
MLKEQIFAAGVIGAGGAGFPTHVKLVEGAKLLVVNAAECEPLLASDRYVMRHFAHEIVAGLAAIAKEYRIPRVVIGTKGKYVREIAALQAAIDAKGADIEIFPVESFYPAGDEQVLIYEITGETVPPGGIPIALGIVVVNVTTILNISRARSGQAVTRRYITVNGEVGRPIILDAPVGAFAEDLIQAAGGATIREYVVIRGGPMMGRQYRQNQVAGISYGKADGGLLVVGTENPVVRLAAKPAEHIIAQARSVCIQCSLCTEMCPRYLIGHKMRPNRVMRSVGTNTHPLDLEDALLCCECGICEVFACPMGLSPRRMNVLVKADLRAAGVKVADADIYLDQTRPREYRRVSQSRLIERINLGAYPNHLDDSIEFEPNRVKIPTRHG